MIWPGHIKEDHPNKNTRCFVLFSPQLILVITATSGGGVFFSEQEILAYFGQFGLFCREFTHFLAYRYCGGEPKMDKYEF